jgi:hypothetical protein
MRNGYFRLGRWRGVPVWLHVTMPVLALLYSRFRFVPVFWLASVALVLFHEQGHAMLVRRFGHRVKAIRLHPLGGECSWEGQAVHFERAVVAWGGVLAQAAVLLPSLLLYLLPDVWPGTPIWQIREAWVPYNALLIVINLLPVPPLDGSKAWPVVGIQWAAWREHREYQREKRLRREGREPRSPWAAKIRPAPPPKPAPVEDEAVEPPPPVPEVSALLEQVTAGFNERRERSEK